MVTSTFTGAAPSAARSRLALAGLMAAHVAADIALAHATVACLGCKNGCSPLRLAIALAKLHTQFRQRQRPG